ncbi:MAG: serine hydrolase [Anaerolineaceae bacterium]|nr:serine hydrolase [Anaerolineaceae bacterium]
MPVCWGTSPRVKTSPLSGALAGESLADDAPLCLPFRVMSGADGCQRLGERVLSAIDAGIFPAASLAVMHRNSLVINRAWGWVDPAEKMHRTSSQTLFDCASLTKLFTTTVFLQLVSEGKIKLEDRLSAVIPEFSAERLRPIVGQQDPHTLAPIAASAEAGQNWVDAETVTFQHLLTHTAGLPAWRALFFEVRQPDPLIEDHEERWRRLLPFICRYPFHSVPASQLVYSDLGMILLGLAITRLTRRTLPEALEEYVSQPLKLGNICFQPRLNGRECVEIAPTEYDDRWRKRRIWGEVHDENAAAMGGVAGHAGLFGTAEDVVRFGEAWRTNAIDLNLELHQKAIQEQAASASEKRGLGWELYTAQGSSAGDHFHETAYGHTGFTGTSLWIDPERELVVALLTNRVYRGRHEEGIHEFRRQMHDLLTEVMD